jgi:hypothetical protein
MANEPIIRQDLSPEALAAIEQIVNKALRTITAESLQEKLLSPAETRKLFQPGISRPTLVAWTKDGRLKSYTMGKNIYYKYSEVIEAAKELKRYKR